MSCGRVTSSPSPPERPHHLVVPGPGRQVGDHVVAVEEAHRVLLQAPAGVVADHHDDRQVVPDERVDVHQREAGGAVAEQQHHLAAGSGQPGGDRVAQTGAEAAVGPGVQPAAGRLRLDVLPGERHEVAAVADHDRVVGQPAVELAVDPHRVHRVGVAVEQRAVLLDGGPRGVLQPGRPPVVRRGAAGALPRLQHAVQDHGQVAGCRAASSTWPASWPGESARCTTAAGAPSLPPKVP